MGMWRQGEAVIISCLSSARRAPFCALRSGAATGGLTLFVLSEFCHIYWYTLHDHTSGVGTVHRFFEWGGGWLGRVRGQKWKISILL